MKVLVLAGTGDGREIAKQLQAEGHEVLVSTLTEYGASLAEREALEVRHGALDEARLIQLLREGKFAAVVDATHPFAENIQALAARVCAELQLPYYRWERPSAEIGGDGVYWVEDIAKGAELAAKLGNRILLTTGSRHLEKWLASPHLKGKELFIRVLPTVAVIQKCEQLGLKPYQIIAVQGPFSREFNEVLIKNYRIDVMIAKDSGPEGGTAAKAEACRNLNIPLVILKRPPRSLVGAPWKIGELRQE